jgi:two-component system sensor histidine kinase UhpB
VLLSSASRLDDAEAMRQKMREAVDQLSGDIQSLRSMIAELRPPALDELGLGPALTSLAQRTSTTTGLDVRSDIDVGADRRLTADIETIVYRIVQESLTNVAKHANAAIVELSVRCAEHDLHISVSDDGVGFAAEGERGGGFGLAGMRERVGLAGGELSVLRGTDAGTVVRARLPLG